MVRHLVLDFDDDEFELMKMVKNKLNIDWNTAVSCGIAELGYQQLWEDKSNGETKPTVKKKKGKKA